MNYNYYFCYKNWLTNYYLFCFCVALIYSPRCVVIVQLIFVMLFVSIVIKANHRVYIRFTSFHFQATKVYTEQLLELHRGQGMEIYWRDNFQCPSEEEYRSMTIRSKFHK